MQDDLNAVGAPRPSEGRGQGWGSLTQTFHIGTVQQLNPVATTVTNNYYGDTRGKKGGQESAQSVKSVAKEEIIAYVSKALPLVSDDWRNRYTALWCDILAIPEVDAEVYSPGKQQGTRFNRALVANILHFLGNYQGKRQGIFTKWEAKSLALQLEGTWECSTRTHLGIPPSTAIQIAIKNLLPKHLPRSRASHQPE